MFISICDARSWIPSGKRDGSCAWTMVRRAEKEQRAESKNLRAAAEQQSSRAQQRAESSEREHPATSKQSSKQSVEQSGEQRSEQSMEQKAEQRKASHRGHAAATTKVPRPHPSPFLPRRAIGVQALTAATVPRPRNLPRGSKP